MSNTDDRFRLSGAQLSLLNAFLPSGLTVAQTNKVLEAARVMASEVWRDAQAAYAAQTYAVAEAQRYERELKSQSTDPHTKPLGTSPEPVKSGLDSSHMDHTNRSTT